MTKRLPNPAVFLVDGVGVIDLEDVHAVICAVESESPGPTCRVILSSGVSFHVDMRYSKSLIQAVEWSRSPASVARPRDGFPDQGELVHNSWNWDIQSIERETMSKKDRYIERVRSALNSATTELERGDHIEALEEIAADVDAMIEAAKEDAAKEEARE